MESAQLRCSIVFTRPHIMHSVAVHCIQVHVHVCADSRSSTSIREREHWNGTVAHLDRILDLQGWHEDRQHEGGKLLHVAVLGYQQDERKDKWDHLVVTKLPSKGGKDTLEDDALRGGGG